MGWNESIFEHLVWSDFYTSIHISNVFFSRYDLKNFLILKKNKKGQILFEVNYNLKLVDSAFPPTK